MFASTSIVLALSAVLAEASPIAFELSNGISIPTAQSTTNNPKLATVYTSCTVPHTVALTFDDGPHSYESELVDRLDAAGIKATFFVNGNNWDCIYEDQYVQSLRKAYASGHQIASHTWAHLNLSELDWGQLQSEFKRTDLALKRILGVVPAYMRPPYGAYNDLVRKMAYTRNQTIVNWDFYTGDASDNTTTQCKTAYDEVIASRPTSILALNHEPYDYTVRQVIPYAIQQIREKLPGYKFVTVVECLGGKQKPYQWIGKQGTPDASWTC